MEEITELDDKYLVLKWRDITEGLNDENTKLFADIVQKVDAYRRLVREKPVNKYVVLNMDDKIDLSVWSPILKHIKELEESHQILVHENKSKTRRETRHDGKPDYVKDIAVTLVNAIIKAEGKE